MKKMVLGLFSLAMSCCLLIPSYQFASKKPATQTIPQGRCSICGRTVARMTMQNGKCITCWNVK